MRRSRTRPCRRSPPRREDRSPRRARLPGRASRSRYPRRPLRCRGRRRRRSARWGRCPRKDRRTRCFVGAGEDRPSATSECRRSRCSRRAVAGGRRSRARIGSIRSRPSRAAARSTAGSPTRRAGLPIRGRLRCRHARATRRDHPDRHRGGRRSTRASRSRRPKAVRYRVRCRTRPVAQSRSVHCQSERRRRTPPRPVR